MKGIKQLNKISFWLLCAASFKEVRRDARRLIRGLIVAIYRQWQWGQVLDAGSDEKHNRMWGCVR